MRLQLGWLKSWEGRGLGGPPPWEKQGTQEGSEGAGQHFKPPSKMKDTRQGDDRRKNDRVCHGLGSSCLPVPRKTQAELFKGS